MRGNERFAFKEEKTETKTTKEMIELKKDKSGDTWLLTQTDKEGFHKQMNFTKEELDEVCKTWKEIYNN